ncbi:MAG TPA: hypothetical protein VFN30_10305 [Chitinophagaceae bacterium]|nr:hypothetical protein [Chitinophagaceae bacterium]
MKSKLLSLATAIWLFSSYSFSQDINFRSAREKNSDKLSLFSNVAEHTPADINLIKNLFGIKMGHAVIIKFSDDLQLNGQVIMVEQETTLQSITIRCTNFPNALLTISKVVKEDGTIQYTGAIINNRYKDIICLEKVGNENYVWTKKNLSDVIPD